MLTRPNLVRLLEYNRYRHRQREKMIPNPHPPGSPMWIELELLRITNNDAIDVMPISP